MESVLRVSWVQCMDMLLTPERSEQSEMEHESTSLKQDVAFFTEDRAAALLTRMVSADLSQAASRILLFSRKPGIQPAASFHASLPATTRFYSSCQLL